MLIESQPTPQRVLLSSCFEPPGLHHSKSGRVQVFQAANRSAQGPPHRGLLRRTSLPSFIKASSPRRNGGLLEALDSIGGILQRVVSHSSPVRNELLSNFQGYRSSFLCVNLDSMLYLFCKGFFATEINPVTADQDFTVMVRDRERDLCTCRSSHCWLLNSNH